MKNLYVSSNFFFNTDLETMMNKTKRYGFSGIEVWAQQFDLSRYSRKECRTLSDQYGLKNFVHAKSWDLNFASLNQNIRNTSIEEIKRSIDLADALAISEVTVHPPQMTLVGDRDRSLRLGRNSLAEIVSYGESKNIDVSIELMEKLPHELVTSYEEFTELADGFIDQLKVTIDIAHCDSLEEFEHYFDVFDNISKIHLSNRKGNVLHTPLYEGDYDFSSCFDTILKKNLPIVLEGFDARPGLMQVKKEVSYIKKIMEENNGF
ncbi:sugar phosphate isomerase/epimerase family protein [Acetobacterium carbinolicum]|jgi:sugar phosphate isomerase/epimerase|uniref:sugar phosphate isomerase/epimerase family protein n=1 Tax=Acetobacterium TaxID=33951 RepID=UPI000DBEBA35|nr:MULTISPECIES: sugar phosphate isomerase/epimerase family protein [unclassified Acetobacterium]AWW27019.1 sugar phosphate isomerase/epimerase [Acetobacterium sp. KB-1]MDK2943105.1 hypothetical protein [Acetobacterium sp.]MDZ5725633.1 sugar phosphate isomerase/epimerase family protein [Acetobacterium sp. K1/6]